MNLGIFNRVNLKECEGGGMYSEWASLANPIRHECFEIQSVLAKVQSDASKEVALAIARELTKNIGLTQLPGPSPLNTDADVLWCMEVICHGLSLPLAEHDAIRDCVNIYCDWLTALQPSFTASVPRPILDDPNPYIRKIIGHLHNLFIPRKGEGGDMVKRQAVLCHRVLRTLQQAAQCSTIMSVETWESLLVFLLAINETLLATPTVPDDIGDQLCERVLSVLFDVWLIACGKCFPSPPLWRTLREMAITWRHRIALISTWSKVTLALTHRLLTVMCPPNFPKHQYYENDPWAVPSNLCDDAVAQAWFRFLHSLGSPIDLCRPQIISQTPKFLQDAMLLDMDPSSHPCLSILPINFLVAIKGISNIVDAFLGVTSDLLDMVEDTQKKETPTPPPFRKPTKSFSVSSASHKGPAKNVVGTSGRAMSTPSANSSSISSIAVMTGSLDVSSISSQVLAPARPKCNSLLHLFGEWLFEAAHTGGKLHPHSNTWEFNTRCSGSLSSAQSDSLEADLSLTATGCHYQAGRATALAALCRIFCSKKTGEQILPVYYSRFYLALHHGLKINSKKEVEEPVVSILMNSADLLRLDLDGIQIVIPSILEALEKVLPENELNIKLNINISELRKNSIHILLSMLPLPLHFSVYSKSILSPSQNLTLCIKDLIGPGERPQLTFAQLKSRIINLLINSLQVETDPYNTHLLLGGLLVMVQDTASVEQLVNNDAMINTSQHSESASCLFVKATYLVCHRLISSWKSDLGISLAALELLCGLANSGIQPIEQVEWERGVKWICDYIVYQCWKPPQAHSKDLHSSVVAAFNTVSVWIMAQPSLLKNKQCLSTVLEVVELGISGSKSQGKRRDEPVKMKDEKELKPVSMRVRDAAEALLTIILEHAGYFSSLSCPETMMSVVDENTLLKHSSTSCTSFKYFILHNNIILGLLDDPLGNHEEPQPEVNVILRGGFGRHAWNFQLRQLPRHRSNAIRGKSHSGPGRPIFLNCNIETPLLHHSFFPENIKRIPQYSVERSIPDLDGDVYPITALMNHQKDIENELLLEEERNPKYCKECTPPGLCEEFQTARLFLSHFGFLNKLEGGKLSVVALDSKKVDFFKELDYLDKMEARTNDICHIFYIRAKQSHYQHILANVESNTLVSNNFLYLLKTIGSPINVPEPHRVPDIEGWSGGGCFSGHKNALYWSDSISQVTFIVPTLQPQTRLRHNHNSNDDKMKRHLAVYPTFVVWLENIEDHINFPLDEMIVHTNCGQEGWSASNCTVIFIHALQSNLFRIKFQPSSNRPCVAIPLVDGVVVSKNKIGSFIRQSVLNNCRRKRLDNESYLPPHTRRRLKIEEIKTKYQLEESQASLLSRLFL